MNMQSQSVLYDTRHGVFIVSTGSDGGGVVCSGSVVSHVSEAGRDPIFGSGGGPDCEKPQANPKNRIYPPASQVMKKIQVALSKGVNGDDEAYQILESQPGMVRVLGPSSCPPAIESKLNVIRASNQGEIDRRLEEHREKRQRLEDERSRAEARGEAPPPWNPSEDFLDLGSLNADYQCFSAPNGDVLVFESHTDAIAFENSQISYTNVFAVYRSGTIESRRLNDEGYEAYEKGNYAQAIDHFEKAKSIDPEYLQAILNLASVYALTGQKSLALENIDAAQHLDLATTVFTVFSEKEIASILEEPAIRNLKKQSKPANRGEGNRSAAEEIDAGCLHSCLGQVDATEAACRRSCPK